MAAQPQPTRTYDFSGGTNAVADEVDTDLNTLYTVLQGGIGNTHIASDAAIDTSKLATGAAAAFTPSPTGFSGTPTVNCKHITIGKIVFAWVSITGTSNGAGLTFSLPAAALEARVYVGFQTTDNSVNNTTSGRINTAAGSATATAFVDCDSSTWTASGTKAIRGLFIYEKS